MAGNPACVSHSGNECAAMKEPELLRRFVSRQRHNHSRCIEVWRTSCIVQNFGKLSKAQCTSLINPSNPHLSGVRNFPYFPRGGPVPQQSVTSMHKDWQPLGYVSAWGGMEVGSGMMYSVSVVDGLVHQLGGWKLRAACEWHRILSSTSRSDDGANGSGEPCPVGSAIKTVHACHDLLQHYDAILHTTPPFYKFDSDSKAKLQQCYHSALSLLPEIIKGDKQCRVASPLLGAGARGFPAEIAVDVAAGASARWLEARNVGEHLPGDPTSSASAPTSEMCLVFGLLEVEHAETLAKAIDEHLQRSS